MKTIKIFYIFSLLGILSLIFLNQFNPSYEGTISSIKYSSEKITLQVEHSNKTLVVFTNDPIPLEKGDRIIFQGKEEIYRGEKQIILERIWKKND